MAAAWAVSLGAELFVYFWLGFDVAPWADHHFGKAPLFRILGYIVGIGCPINALVRVVRDYNRAQKNDENDDHGPGPDKHD